MTVTDLTGATIRLRRRVAVVALVALAGLALTAASAGAQSTASIDVADNSFNPSAATVTVGDTVTWTQSGNNPHTITADDGSFDSHPNCPPDFTDCSGNGDTFSITADSAGQIAYHCKIHGGPGGVGMSGVITVQAAAAEEPTEAPEPEPTEEPTDEDDGAAVSGSIAASDQSGDGTTVSVDSVEISGASGFVVVHLDADGAPGPVLGHAAIPEGRSTNVIVTLDDPLTEDATVWPMLHQDAGEVGTYEFPGADTPVTVDGAVVMLPISYTIGAAAAQPADELAETGVEAGTIVVLAAIGLVLGTLGVLAVNRRPRGERG